VLSEIAGEIKDLYPSTSVTIVQGGDAVLNSTYKPKFRSTAGQSLAARGVNIIYGDHIDSFPADGALPDGITTRNGKKIDADLFLTTRGGRPNTTMLASSGFTLNERGQVPVEPTLLAKGRKDVFAVGDITDIKEEKQSAKHGAHVATVVPNILAVLENKAPSKNYGGATEIMVLTNGKVRRPPSRVVCLALTSRHLIERGFRVLWGAGWDDHGQLVRSDGEG
jgi:NADH dehydrogenase FAD-containing subunit